MVRYVTIFFPIIFALTLASVQSNEKKVLREDKIGGFNFGSQLISNRELIKLYGPGCVDKDYPYHYKRLYYFPQKKCFAAFDIGTDDLVVGLKLTTIPLISKNCVAVNELPNYETSRNITLGDGREKVIQAYGRPSKEESKTDNRIIFRYYVGRQEGPYMEMEFINDKVASIFITVGD
jgi:hypothetical protein